MNSEDVMAALDPKLRKRLFLASDAPKTEYCRLPSVGLTKALNGGLVYGRQVLIWGSKSSAKSSLCLQTVAQAQKDGKVCAWVDAEMSFDESWARAMGVDTEKLIYSTARTVNDMVDIGTALMKAGVDLIVVDSISSLLPAVYFEKDSHDLKDLDQTKQIGAEARDMANAVKMLNYANNQVKPTLLILISQARNNISQMYTKQEPTGGLAVKYYSSTVIKLFSSESDAQAIKGKIAVGDRLLERKVARKVRWELQFSKTSPAMQGGEYDFYFVGDNIGIDSDAELIDIAVQEGVVKQTGAWYYYGEDKWHGRPAMIESIRKDSVLRSSLVKDLS